MNVCPKKLTDLQYQVMTSEERSIVVNFPFTPVVECPNSQQPVITNHPLKLIKKTFIHNIPIMMGIMHEEGVALASYVLNSMEMYEQTLETQLIPFHLKVNNKKVRNDAFVKIKKFYFNDQALSIETVPNLVQVLGDNTNKFAGYLSSELHHLHQRFVQIIQNYYSLTKVCISVLRCIFTSSPTYRS